MEALLILIVVVVGLCLFVLSLIYKLRIMSLEEKVLNNPKSRRNSLVRLELLFPFVKSPANDPDLIKRRKLYSKYLLCFLVFGVLLMAALLIVQPSSS